MAANTTGQAGIGNIIIASNGIPHGLGTLLSGGSNGQLYNKATIAGVWAGMSNGTPGAAQGSFKALVEFQSYIYQTYGVKSGGALNDGSALGIWWTAISNATSSFQAFSADAITVSNAVVHPATGYLYIGHNNLIAQVNSVAGTYADAALTLPTGAVITSITPFGNYLAIAARLGSATFPKSKVFLWNLNTTTTWDYAIDWTGDLQNINTLYGDLIGVSLIGGTGYSLDRSGIVISEYTLGGIPQKIREVSTERQTTTAPSAQVNPNVSFVFNDKFYFSADIVGGSTSPKYYGLWSLSKSRITNEWCVTIEQGATSDNSETSVLAAAKLQDYVWMVHTANGTVTRNIDNADGDFSATTFNNTSFYESVVNPNMDEADYEIKKQLTGIRFNFYLPGPTAQVTLYYRADRATAWTSIVSKTSSSPDTETCGYQQTAAGASQFTAARYYEFRLESIGAAEITGFSYDYIPFVGT